MNWSPMYDKVYLIHRIYLATKPKLEEQHIPNKGYASTAAQDRGSIKSHLAKEGVFAEGYEALLLSGRPQDCAIITAGCGFYTCLI